MNAYELLKPDLSPSGVWACGKCDKTYAHPRGGGKMFADRCCDFRCVACGIPCQQHYAKCNACIERERADKETARFEKAEKLDSWDGWVWTNATPHNEGYFSSVEELVEWFDDGSQNDDGYNPCIPDYAWICDPSPLVRLNIDSILQSIGEGLDEDFDSDDLKGIAELTEALEAFNEANKEVVSYHPCNDRVVLIEPVLRAMKEQQETDR